MKVADEVFYVTGGASGLGRATVIELHEMQGYISIWDTDLARAQDLASSLNALGGKDRAIAFKVDVSSEDQVQNAITKTDEAWPSISVGGCVNCAGIIGLGGLVNRKGRPLNYEHFTKVIQVNLIGTFNVSRLTAARFLRDVSTIRSKLDETSQDLGVIINTASVAGLEGQTATLSYSTSKGGVVAMTLPMARDLAQFGIRVMAIAPGLFKTLMSGTIQGDASSALLHQLQFPVFRLGIPEEFAHVVIFLIQDSMMNGTYIRLDGAVRLGKL